jgi:SWI/SNF-related matrix-associated actin-dependent regulator 1 of chromatin subfamily A
METRQLLKQAIDTLAARCDGANAQDGQGFSRLDAPLGHNIAAKPASEWTDRQAAAAYQMLRKYSTQLAAYGLDYAAIPQPPKPTTPPPARRIVMVTGNNDRFFIEYPFSYDLNNAVKMLAGWKFNKADKIKWSVPASINADALLNFADLHGFDVSQAVLNRLAESAEKMQADLHGFDVSQAVLNRLAESAEKMQANLDASRAASIEESVEITGLGGTLRPFQASGVSYASKAMEGCLIADEMGLGKTVEALALIQYTSAYPALIVCPATLKRNWADEAAKWLPGRRVVILNGKAEGADVSLDNGDIFITNYDVAHKLTHTEKRKDKTGKDKTVYVSDVSAAIVVFDESHYLKNYQSRRTVVCTAIAKKIPRRVLLTGTPVLNRPQELISQLGIIHRLADLGGFWEFAKRYCNYLPGQYGGLWGWDMHIPAQAAECKERLAELNTRMRASGFYLRREKADVLGELPPKARYVVKVQLDNFDEYHRAEDDLVEWIRETKGDDAAWRASQAEALTRIEALKQIAARGKLAAIREWCENFLDAGSESGEKLVVFATHTAVVEELASAFDAPMIYGNTPLPKRDEAVHAFQENPKTRVIVGNVKAMGVGLTLTAASNTVFAELGWTPGEHDQAEDRVHRIGQTDNVAAWYFIGDGTIDEDIYALIEQKRVVVTATTTGEIVDGGANILDDLVGRLEGRGVIR